MGLCCREFLDVLFTFLCLHIFIVQSDSYTNRFLEDDRVCGLFISHEIPRLGMDDKSAVIVKQSKYLSEFTGIKGDFLCEFVVKASFNQGIFAVIQKMNLRKNATTNECIDYVQLCKHDSNLVESAFDLNVIKCKSGSRKYCGEVILPSKFEQADSTYPFSPNAFQEPTGDLGVKIVLSRRKQLPPQQLDLVIAFTAYRTCSSSMGTYKMCSSSNNSGTCIFKEFFNDGVVNCPYLDCSDECDQKSNGFLVNRNVTLTAVTSVFLSFFLFLGCIWLCRYFEILCWSVQNIRRNGSTCANRRNSQISAEDAYTPTAPSLPEHSPDKDLPPSYETLFPDR